MDFADDYQIEVTCYLEVGQCVFTVLRKSIFWDGLKSHESGNSRAYLCEDRAPSQFEGAANVQNAGNRVR